MGEKVKEDLKELEQKYRSLMDGSSDAIIIANTEGNILEINNKTQELLGYSMEECLKLRLTALYPKAEYEIAVNFFNEVLQKGKASVEEILILTKDGKMISAAVNSRIVELPDKKAVLLFLRDITERKQSETLLARLAYFSELNPNPIVEVDLVGHVYYLNPAAERSFPGIQTTGFDHPFLAGLDSLGIVFLREKKDFLIREMKIGDIYYQQSLYYVVERQCMHVYGLDITERKKAEREVIQSEKLSALGRFSAGIAHEVRNPLGIILGGIEFLEKKISKSDENVKVAIEKIKEATLRATNILQNMLRFSKPSEVQIEKITPQHLIDDALSLLKYSNPLKHIQIQTEFAEGEEMYIEVDKNQMEQVLFNILINAAEAMPKGGEIKIKTYKTSMPESEKSACAMEVVDQGTGIEEENLSKIFEPFFTTKGKRGTGLGLATAQMIVNSYKGILKIESKVGKGTAAKILVPLVLI
ncbi:MAG: PAS domain S-box protein [Candidatus Omnitrophica bacterium]|nr:PAS domain S-box protein [Candidatus Omnitrophota bacterium]